MDFKQLDCSGMACPQPVITTKKELERLKEQGKGLEITVDNLPAKENLLKLGASQGMKSRVRNPQEGVYIVTLEPAQENLSTREPAASADSVLQSVSQLSQESAACASAVVLLGSDQLGSGEAELGQLLAKGFLYTLTETTPAPSHVLLINRGVFLATERPETITHLKTLEALGTQVMICGTCLDYYHLKDKLQVGSVVNMYDIVETLTHAPNKLIL